MQIPISGRIQLSKFVSACNDTARVPLIDFSSVCHRDSYLSGCADIEAPPTDLAPTGTAVSVCCCLMAPS